MTLEFYKLKEQPFGSAPNARFLFMSSTHRDAVGALLRALQAGRGFVTLMAPAGLGKTTLLFHTLNSFGDRVVTVYLFEAAKTPVDLLKAISGDMGANGVSDDPDDMLLQLTELLTEQHRLAKRVVVVLDEAQNLALPVLELVKTLSRLEASRGKLVQMILCGRPELADALASIKIAQSTQRLSPAVHLEAFSAEDTKQYVDHRLRTAGYDRELPLFTGEAGSLIARYSRGVPRTINNICFHCLSLGYKNQRERIEGDIVREVAEQLQLALPSGVIPLVLAKENPAQVRPQAPPSQAAAVRPRSMLPQMATAVEVVSIANLKVSVVGKGQSVLPQRAEEDIPMPRLPQASSSPAVAARAAAILPQLLDLDESVLGQPVLAAQAVVAGARPPVLSEAPAREGLIAEPPKPSFLPQVCDPVQEVPLELGEKQSLIAERPPVAFAPSGAVPAELPMPSPPPVVDEIALAALAFPVLPTVRANDIPISMQAISLQRTFAEMPVAAPPAGWPTLSGAVPPQPDSLQMEGKRNPVSSLSQLLVTPLIEVKRNQDSGASGRVPAELVLPQDAVPSAALSLTEDGVAPAFVVHSFPRLAMAVIFVVTVIGSAFAVYRVTTVHHNFPAGKALPGARSSLPALRDPIAATPTVPLAEIPSAPVAAHHLPVPGHDLKGMDLGSALHALSGRSLSRICTINFGTCDSKHLNELRKVNPRLKDPD